MIKEARLLKEKAVNSLLLSIDHFNRVTDVGRPEAVLIFADHSFEMRLKAAILARAARFGSLERRTPLGSTDASAKRFQS